MWFWLLLFVLSLWGSEERVGLIPSTPDEIGSLRSELLVGGCVHPLSGSLCLRAVDLVARGAQDICLGRVFIPPSLAPPSPVRSEIEQYLRERDFLAQMHKTYRGWVFLPHLQLERIQGDLKVPDSNGAIYTFRGGKVADLFGMSNAAGDVPLGVFDPRNIRVIEGGREVTVLLPDGAKRIYEIAHSSIYFLQKEILPNGKVLKYAYEDGHIAKIESLDPAEKLVYASMTFGGKIVPRFFDYKERTEGETCGDYTFAKGENWKKSTGLPYFQIREAKTNTGLTAEYDYQWNQFSRTLEKKCGVFNYKGSFPSSLALAGTPVFREEKIAYHSFLPSRYSGKEQLVQCTYKGQRIETIQFPVGEKEEFVSLYTLQYDPPVAGKKGGSTSVDFADGCQKKYLFTKHLLVDSILFLSPDKKSGIKKIYSWDRQHHLQGIEYRDLEGKLLWKRGFEENDDFGNPQREIFIGDLTGGGTEETYEVKRRYSEDGRNLLVREETEEGLITTFEYVPSTNLVKVKTVQNPEEKIFIQETYDYDHAYNLIQKCVEAEGEKHLTLYHLRQNAPFFHMPEWIEEQYGIDSHLLKKTKLTYDSLGYVSKEEVYGSDGLFAYSVERKYDEQGNLRSVTNPLGAVATYEYDTHGRNEKAVNESGRLVAKKTYDLGGRLRELTETGDHSLVHTTRYNYDLFSRLEEKIDPFDNATRYTDYDKIADQPTRIEYPSCSEGAVTSGATFDPLGRVLSRTDANLHTITYTYNAYGFPVEITYPNGSKETFSYYKNGRTRGYTDREGRVTETVYDALGRLIHRQFLLGSEVLGEESFVYDSLHLKSHTDIDGYTTTYTYDKAGRKAEENREGRVTKFGYDSLGRLNKEIHLDKANTLCVERKFDALGQVLEEKETDFIGHVLFQMHFTYDLDGNQKTVTRYPQNTEATTRFAYDPFSRLREIEDPLGFKTTTSYDESQKNSLDQRILTKIVTDPNQIATTMVYDPWGREASRKVGGRLEERTYDPAGNLLEVKEEERITRYTYNDLDLPETLTRPFGTRGERTTRFTYTPSGLLKTKQWPDGTVLTSTYDPWGHLKTLSSDSIFHTFEYSPSGFLLYASDGGHTIERTPDPFGNILSETIDSRFTIVKTYDAQNRPLTLTLPNGETIVYRYDPLYLREIEYSSMVHKFNRYDLDGHVLSEMLPCQLGLQIRSYDPCGRLSALNSLYFSQNLTYDPAGRVEKVSSDGSYTYDLLSQLESEPNHTYAYDARYNRIEKDHSATPVNGRDELMHVPYDLNGNLKEKEGCVLFYDSLNRLTSAQSDQVDLAFTYDPLNRRLFKASNGETEFYFYNGDRELGAYDRSGTLKELRTPISLELQGELFIPITDYRGNVRRLIDPNTKKVAQSIDYTAFGEELGPIQMPFNPWRYSSQRLDPELNLVYFGHRYYNPITGRWITTDPAGFQDGMNLYAYVLNNPLSYADLDGRFAIPLLSWTLGGAVACPLTWGFAAVVAVGYVMHQMSESGAISKEASTLLTGIGGAVVDNIIQDFSFSADKEISVAYNSSAKKAPPLQSQNGSGFSPENPDDDQNNERFWQQLTRQYSKDGERSIVKSYKSLNKLLDEHNKKLPNLEYKSSVEREINTFNKQLKTLEQFAKSHDITLPGK